jgi:hypothetical protein
MGDCAGDSSWSDPCCLHRWRSPRASTAAASSAEQPSGEIREGLRPAPQSRAAFGVTRLDMRQYPSITRCIPIESALCLPSQRIGPGGERHG